MRSMAARQIDLGRCLCGTRLTPSGGCGSDRTNTTAVLNADHTTPPIRDVPKRPRRNRRSLDGIGSTMCNFCLTQRQEKSTYRLVSKSRVSSNVHGTAIVDSASHVAVVSGTCGACTIVGDVFYNLSVCVQLRADHMKRAKRAHHQPLDGCNAQFGGPTLRGGRDTNSRAKVARPPESGEVVPRRIR